MRRRTLSEAESMNVPIKRYSFTGNSERQIEFPVNFVPQTVIFYDNYPNDYYLQNGSVSYETNGVYAVHIHDGNYECAATPYSLTAASSVYNVRNFVSYQNGILTLNPYAAYKSFGNHTYTIIIIGEMESEELKIG